MPFEVKLEEPLEADVNLEKYESELQNDDFIERNSLPSDSEEKVKQEKTSFKGIVIQSFEF